MATSQDSGDSKQSRSVSNEVPNLDNEPTVVLGMGAGSKVAGREIAPSEDVPPPAAIPTPTLDDDGTLVTHLGEPSKAAHVAGVARAAQARARQDVASIAAGLAEIAASMHRLA